MAFFLENELKDLYTESVDEKRIWQRDYSEFERLADNGLIEDLDEFEPEVNDGSLAAALFKLPKRIVNSKLTGRAKALDADDAWITELANIQWENNIVPNANSQAPFHRKWKDAVRKAAIYGAQPVINLFVTNGNYTGSDFIVPQAQDVTLEAGKVSDYDSDVIFWDVYYSKKQVRDMIEQAKIKDGLNKWNVKELQNIYDSKIEEEREDQDTPEGKKDKSVKNGGIRFTVVFQRGVEAPFYMYHLATDKVVREWPNPDPTGDIPVHYLYCYQDFVNPYGIGIVKLAGGTQNVLDYYRRADVLMTQLGTRPPKLIEGNADDIDEDSLVYAQDANWFVGQAKVTRMEIANGVYSQLPQRTEMAMASLNKLLPMGDTSVSASAGDPLQSRTPAGVKFQAAQLSIDDDDFKDNLYMTYEAVAKSMINTHFANMQGTDLMKVSDEERDILAKSGIDFPINENGEPTNELQIMWDEARATFDFEMEAEEDKESDVQKRLDALLKVVELRAADPTIEQSLMQSGKRLNIGELFGTIISLTTDNDKILEDIDPEEMGAMAEEQAMQEQMAQEQMIGEEQGAEMMQDPGMAMEQEPTAEMAIQAIMEDYGVSEGEAMAMLEAESAGFSLDEILEALNERRANA
jgi:hypothetical protein